MKPILKITSVSRLEGLDLARFLAFVGMVIVNFKIVMGASKNPDNWMGIFTHALEGRAAATFVVLAGIGLGLASERTNQLQNISVTLKRAAFLLVVGLLNSLIFDADIIHYYAFYFLFGVFLLPLQNGKLIATIIGILIAFVVMIISLEYDTGWNWANYSYADFWTPIGFVRNLFFNGWHPVIPWLSFLILGVWLSRLGLHQTNVQNKMIAIGMLIFVTNGLLSKFLITNVAEGNIELAALFGTSPIPPMPLYMIAGMSFATIIIGICLRSANLLHHLGILHIITPAGRQTLTLYIAHILIGMGMLQELGLFGSQSIQNVLMASLIFCVLATLYAFVWSRFFKRGPIEAIMRKLAG